ncbi:hypothetical protein LCGC14_2387400 [marine sediment metagenome]|uniref:Uncharacterized protein n=1 Tax=marine sediment metagenome TaxID=412755 RepID=A0A0F9ETV2_9ZZZZ
MNCSKCGRFSKRIRDAVGLSLSTCFPPDKPKIASTVPYVPFVCNNHGEWGSVEYQPVNFEWGGNK